MESPQSLLKYTILNIVIRREGIINYIHNVKRDHKFVNTPFLGFA